MHYDGVYLLVAFHCIAVIYKYCLLLWSINYLSIYYCKFAKISQLLADKQTNQTHKSDYAIRLSTPERAASTYRIVYGYVESSI